MKKKIIIGLAALLIVAGILYRFFRPEHVEEYESRPTVEVQNPQEGDIILYTEMTGQVEPASKASVMPKIDGELLEGYFQAGDRVEAGQALCRIDSDALTSLELQMESARIAMENANSSLSRTQPLYASGYVSQQEMEQVQNAAQSARIAYESAKNQYDLQVEYTTVAAPISGVVESRNVDPHDHVNTSTEICVISGSDQLQITFGITERTLQTLKTGDAIEIEKNGMSYEGTVTEIGSMVNSAGLYDVKARMDKTGGLTTGSRVKINVVMSRAENVMTVPVDAVSYDDGAPFVYCNEGGVAKKTMIESGIYDQERMEVLSGLTYDSQVITTWSNELVDGAEILTAESQTPEDAAEAADQEGDGSQEAAPQEGTEQEAGE